MCITLRASGKPPGSMREVHQDLEPESNLKSDFRLGFFAVTGLLQSCGSLWEFSC